MSAGLYEELGLVSAYDVMNPPGAEDAFLVSVAGDPPQRILDLGCGTGRLSMRLADMGHEVTGLEPAGLMLDRARARAGAETVSWIRSEAAALDVTTRFDLVVMGGHVFQVFLEDDHARAVLRSVARHLTTEGRLVFGSRNPAAREWESWTPQHGTGRRHAPGIGGFEAHWDLTEVDGPFVTYETHLTSASGATHRGVDTIRFRERREIIELLDDAGLDAAAIYGDWERGRWTPASPEIVIVAKPSRDGSSTRPGTSLRREIIGISEPSG